MQQGATDMLVLRVGRTPFCKSGNDLNVLQQHGIRSERAETGRDALDFLRLYDYDLVLMDLQLGDVPAYEVVRTMRAAEFNVPVMILADAATAQAKVRALDQGADDFITVPCDVDELMARIRAVVRRSHGHSNSLLRLGPVELSLHRREVRIHGQPLHLSRREFGVLELLFLKQGTILNKTAFLNHLYCGMEEPEMKTIDVIICRLRKKLAAAGVPTLIDTVWGCGYILRDPTTVPETEALDAPVRATPWIAAVAQAA
jgi:two-component system cell cycle response regulator CtrA